MAVVTLSAVIHREADLYVAECTRARHRCQGSTIEEAVGNLKEATELTSKNRRNPTP